MNKKFEKGITLIALIITIIILLILAVVTIGSIQNSNIITYAQNASKDYSAEKDKEESTISGYESLIESKLPGENSGSKVTYTDEGVPVPAGFKVVTGTKDTGLVIENETEGSQFVWVPVKEDISITGYSVSTSFGKCSEPSVVPSNNVVSALDETEANLEIANCQDVDEDGILELSDFEIELKNIYEEMAASVNKYDGFYVGRYETSINDNGKAQSKPGEISVNALQANTYMWYGLYALQKTYNTSLVKSSMIWGIQYEKMMSWMKNDLTNFNIDNRNTDSERRTGSVSTDIIRNVYDLGGNSFEWTLEACSSLINSRVVRGGSYSSTYTPGYRSISNPNLASGNYGSRLALYIV